jgi:two-component system chemotaxis sensor kinase CheA
VSARDPELTKILVSELERHLAQLDELTGKLDDATLETARRTVHALKGSAGLAGEPELASAMMRLERRLREGDHAALIETASTVRRAIQRLAAGERATVAAAWPMPPADLVAGTTDPLVRAQYIAEVTDRLALIDDAIGANATSEAAAEVYRHVHTMKGAASAVGDEPMAWFCHGLEERLRIDPRTGSSEAKAAKALEEVAKWRAILGTLLEDPDAALATLRGVPVRRTHAPSAWPEEGVARVGSITPPEGDGTVRVSAQSVDRLFDHATGIAVARERVAARVSSAVEHAKTLRRVRTELAEALRLIGPPRPWGAPAAALRRIERAAQSLGELGEQFDVIQEQFKSSDQTLKDDAVAAKRILSTMRQTPIRKMFSRLAAAAHAEARRTGRLVAVRTQGAEEPVDRRLIEALVEPCLQLARNAIAHGIEPPHVRESLGKPREATLTFSAVRRGNRLWIGIADDGAGVDVAAVRARAVETGVVTEVLADAADDQTLLELLFLPGFSTRGQSPDLLAGRGIGLDITLASVQRLGGAIRLSSRHRLGFEARIDVPIESGLATVLWVTADQVELAIPAASAALVRRTTTREAERVPHLAACLEPRVVQRPELVVELAGIDAGDRFSVGVDAVGVTEEVLVRQLSPLLAGIGPYAGAVVRGDGSIRLVLDVHALAPRARALGRVPEGRISEPPSRPGPPSRPMRNP